MPVSLTSQTQCCSRGGRLTTARCTSATIWPNFGSAATRSPARDPIRHLRRRTASHRRSTGGSGYAAIPIGFAHWPCPLSRPWTCREGYGTGTWSETCVDDSHVARIGSWERGNLIFPSGAFAGACSCQVRSNDVWTRTVIVLIAQPLAIRALCDPYGIRLCRNKPASPRYEPCCRRTFSSRRLSFARCCSGCTTR